MRILTSQWKRSLNVIAVGPGWVAAGNDGVLERNGGLEAWSIHSGEVVFSHPRGERVRAAAFDPAGRLFYSLDEGLRVHALPSGMACTAPGPNLDHSDFALSADGRWLLVCSQGNEYGWLSSWQRQADGTFRSVWQEGPQAFHWFGCPTLSADGTYAVVRECWSGENIRGSVDWLMVRRSADSNPIGHLMPEDGRELPFALGLTEAGRLVGLMKRRINLWDFQTVQWVQHQIRNPVQYLFTALAVHPGGRWFATADSAGTVRFWATDTLKQGAAFDWQLGCLRSLAFSPDGALAAAGSDDGRVVVWDVDW